jgi:hypothetical protein
MKVRKKMKTPAILALIPASKDNIVRALVVHWETGEILYKKDFVTVDLFSETVLDGIVSYIEQTLPDIYIHQFSLPKRGSD